MSETIESAGDSTSSADAGIDTGVDAATAQAAATDTTDNNASTDSPASKTVELKGAEKAMAKAKERFEADKNSSSDESEQAAGGADDGKATDSASTQNAADEDTGSTDGSDATSDESGSEDNSDASTATAPDNWPAAMKEQFSALPDDNARDMVLAMNKDMQGGLTKGMQQLKTQIEGNNTLFGLMDKHSVDASAMTDLVSKAVLFNDNPRGLINQLAAEKGIEVFFDEASAKGEVPEFKDAAEMALWAKEQAFKDLKKEQATQAASDQQATAIKATETRITSEFSQAAKDYPDFMDYREPVIEKMSAIGENGVSVDDAYRLSTYDGLRKMADDGQKAVTELAALKQKVEQSKKRDATAPTGGSGEINEDALKNLSAVQRASLRAKERIAKAAH